jgi:hypothetical protein
MCYNQFISHYWLNTRQWETETYAKRFAVFKRVFVSIKTKLLMSQLTPNLWPIGSAKLWLGKDVFSGLKIGWRGARVGEQGPGDSSYGYDCL